MKPPPFLLGAALVFWGWQSDFLLPGLLMGLILECARVVRLRWEFSDEDFSRVWTFCALLFLGVGVYAFTANEGLSNFGGLLSNPDLRTQRNAGVSTARTAAAMFRWLPMIFFPFIAAQYFSTRGNIPLATISLILRRRWKRAKKLGQPPPPARDVNAAYPFFAGTLLAASVHPSEDVTFFWGLCALTAWALWAQRSRRYAFTIWLGTLALAVVLGYFGQRGIGQLQRFVGGLNPTWFLRFSRRSFDPAQARTALGQIGEVKTSGRIVIRIEPREGAKVPNYLREASYRRYGQRQSFLPSWLAGSSRDDVEGVREEVLNSGNWNLLNPKTNSSTVEVACYLDGWRNGSPAGLLPLPGGTWRLEKLPAYVLSKNTAGSLVAEGPGLVVFDALFGPGATIDSPPGTGSTNANRTFGPPPEVPATSSRDRRTPGERGGPPFFRFATTNEDLDVPMREAPALDAVIQELQLAGREPREVLHAVAAFFAEKFSYSTWEPGNVIERPATTNDTPLSRFLLKTRSGHCEYFATATVLLLRRLGIPARYAVGYAVHEASGSGYVVRLRDAHAWTLVWDKDRKTWFDFETTPASWVEAEAKRASATQWLSDAWSRLAFEFARLRWGQSRVREYILLGLVPVLALLLYQIVFRRRRRRGTVGDADEFTDWPGLDSEFYQLEKQLAEHGVPRAESEPLNEWLERVLATPELVELRAPLGELLRLHYRYRFDPLGLSEADRHSLKRDARECLEKVAIAENAVAAGK